MSSVRKSGFALSGCKVPLATEIEVCLEPCAAHSRSARREALSTPSGQSPAPRARPISPTDTPKKFRRFEFSVEIMILVKFQDLEF